jgi:hypothetical protein
VDASSPQVLAPGESGLVWATFRNVGLDSWPDGEPWLVATATWEGRPSELRDEATWPAYDVAARGAGETAPGETASYAWTVRASPDAQATIVERFQLTMADGEALRCPLPAVTVSVATHAPRGGDDPSSGAVAAVEVAQEGCGCRTAGSRPTNRWPLVAGALGALCLRPRRARRIDKAR